MERFEEILSDTHPRNAEEAGRSYGEEDFECELGTGHREGARQVPLGCQPALLPTDHRQSSHHIHHPLSTHLPPDARRKKGGVPKKGKKKPRRASVPGETPTIEEAEEDEDEAGDTEPEPSAEELRPPEAVQVRAGPGVPVPPALGMSGVLWSVAPWWGYRSPQQPVPTVPCRSSFCRRTRRLSSGQRSR